MTERRLTNDGEEVIMYYAALHIDAFAAASRDEAEARPEPPRPLPRSLP